MTTLTSHTSESMETTAHRAVRRTVPLSRVTGVELRKMFDTRSGSWLLASIAILATLAAAAVVVFAPDSQVTFSSFATAIGVPMSVILPVIAILSVTSEWSQRSGLTTFTLVPHRSRVVMAKLIASVGVGVVSVLLAFAIGALGNVIGSALAGVDTVWDVSTSDLALITLGNVLGLLVGFMLGVLIRSSAGAIVAYFVYSFVVPTLSMLLASSQGWFRDLQPWVDFNYAATALYGGPLTAQQWAHLGVTGGVWLLVPTVLGIWLVMRSEVK